MERYLIGTVVIDQTVCQANGRTAYCGETVRYRRPRMTEDRGGNGGKGLSLRDEQRRLTRRRLIEGALVAFDRKGYAATTIDDIVAEANASRATFYLHFKRKADVVLVLAERLGRRWRELYRDLTAGGAPSREQLSAWLDAMVDNYETNRVSLEAIEHAVAIEPEVAEVRLANNRESIGVMADSIMASRGGNPEDARLGAALLIAQMDRFLQLWIIGGLAFDRSRAVARMTDVWLSELGTASRRRHASAARKTA